MEKEPLADVIRRHRKVCWYPSAGMDFRALLFLSDQYLDAASHAFTAALDPEELPDLFVLTDADPFPSGLSFGSLYEKGYSDFKKKHGQGVKRGDYLFCSDEPKNVRKAKTAMVITQITELEPLGLEVRPGLMTWSDRAELLDHALLLRVRIRSKKYLHSTYDVWETDVVYAFTENTAFAFDVLLKNRLKIDWLVCVRYGNAMGGSGAAPNWLREVMAPLGVDYLVAAWYDLGHIFTGGVPEAVEPFFRGLPLSESPTFQEFHNVDSTFRLVYRGWPYPPGGMWGEYGNVYWLRVLPPSRDAAPEGPGSRGETD